MDPLAYLRVLHESIWGVSLASFIVSDGTPLIQEGKAPEREYDDQDLPFYGEMRSNARRRIPMPPCTRKPLV